MDGIRYVNGKEILQAIQHAINSGPKNEDGTPKDKMGLRAFQIDVNNIKETDRVSYIPVNIKVFCGKDTDGTDKWEFVPFFVSVRKCTTRSKIPTYQERLNNPHGIRSVSTQMRGSSKSYWFNPHTRKEEEDPIGEALVAANNIIRHKIAILVKKGELYNNGNTKLNMFVQDGQYEKKTGKCTKKFEDPIIRINIVFRAAGENQPVDRNQTPWQCDIYDAQKPRPKELTPEGEPQYFRATVSSGEDAVEQEITYGNVNYFITGGSSVMGFINASQISLSGSGISLSPRWTAMIVKKSQGFRPNFNAFSDQLNDLGDAETEIIADGPDEGDSSSGSTPTAKSATITAKADASAFDDGELPPDEDLEGGDGAGDAGADELDADIDDGLDDDLE